MASGSPLVLTGRDLTVKVNYILEGPIYGLKDGWCILDIANI